MSSAVPRVEFTPPTLRADKTRQDKLFVWLTAWWFICLFCLFVYLFVFVFTFVNVTLTLSRKQGTNFESFPLSFREHILVVESTVGLQVIKQSSQQPVLASRGPQPRLGLGGCNRLSRSHLGTGALLLKRGWLRKLVFQVSFHRADVVCTFTAC